MLKQTTRTAHQIPANVAVASARGLLNLNLVLVLISRCQRGTET